MPTSSWVVLPDVGGLLSSPCQLCLVAGNCPLPLSLCLSFCLKGGCLSVDQGLVVFGLEATNYPCDYSIRMVRQEVKVLSMITRNRPSFVQHSPPLSLASPVLFLSSLARQSDCVKPRSSTPNEAKKVCLEPAHTATPPKKYKACQCTAQNSCSFSGNKNTKQTTRAAKTNTRQLWSN